MHRKYRTLLAFVLLVAPGLAAAAPWCLVLDAEEVCRWPTAEDCYQASNQVGGYCKPNPRQLGMLGTAPYCVITASERRCTYYSQRQCIDIAMDSNGGCVRNTEADLERRALGLEPDPGCELGDVRCESYYSGQGLDVAGYSKPPPVLLE